MAMNQLSDSHKQMKQQYQLDSVEEIFLLNVRIQQNLRRMEAERRKNKKRQRQDEASVIYDDNYYLTNNSEEKHQISIVEDVVHSGSTVVQVEEPIYFD